MLVRNDWRDMKVININNMTAARYIVTILDNHMIPFAFCNICRARFCVLFIEDNSNPQRASIIYRAYLNEAEITRKNVWTYRSPTKQLGRGCCGKKSIRKTLGSSSNSCLDICKLSSGSFPSVCKYSNITK